jgi:adenosylhomocysteine nucleosidase
VGIVCALSAEARALGPVKELEPPLAVLDDGTLLAVNGMGWAAAAAAASALAGAGAAALISFGLAGGLDPVLEPGAILLPAQILSPEDAPIATAGPWRVRLERAFAPQGLAALVASGPLLTSRRAIASVAAKGALFRDSGAVAVDMESYAVAQVALAQGLPFLAVRVIVDAAGDSLPQAVAVAADAAGKLRPWRLIGALIRSPAELAPLLRLARRFRAAHHSLAAAARALALAPPVLHAGAEASGP